MIRNFGGRAIIFMLFACLYCQHEEQLQGGPYFFRTSKSYVLPHVPVDQIPSEEAMKLDAYYEAYFNDSGKITRFTKYLNGEVESQATYTYRQGGTVEKGVIKTKNGEEIVHNFDKHGKYIRK